MIQQIEINLSGMPSLDFLVDEYDFKINDDQKQIGYPHSIEGSMLLDCTDKEIGMKIYHRRFHANPDTIIKIWTEDKNSLSLEEIQEIITWIYKEVI